MKNIQILLETMVRCGGNCSGCALSSNERMTKNDFNLAGFIISAKKIKSYLCEVIKEDEIESISLFLGQGDHFLLDDETLKEFVKSCENLVPQEVKHKTIILLTASAIGKHEDIRRKMDIIFEESSKLELPMFIQSVFDPKKFIKTKSFKETYMKNIMYFKDKCGMTDLTINLGKDIIEQMSPQEFHEWVIQYKFNHVEVNWVINRFTHEMWLSQIDKMTIWLKDWLKIYKTNPVYEINFIPIASRLLKFKPLELMQTIPIIKESLTDNLYIDSLGNLILCQMGPINNLTPVNERLVTSRININSILTGKQIKNEIENHVTKEAKNIIKKISSTSVCGNCKYISVCAIAGSNIWLNFPGKENGCPWNIDQLFDLLEKDFSDKLFQATAFIKNPVQDEKFKKNGNETSKWFDNEVSKRKKS